MNLLKKIKNYIFWNNINLYIFLKKNIQRKINFQVDIHLFLESNLPKNPTIIEAGAADGNDTLHFARTFPNGKIFALEPMSSLFIKASKKLNDQDNVKLFKYAFNANDGKAEFYLSEKDDKPWGSSSLRKPKEHLKFHPDIKFNNTEVVETISLDSFLTKNKINKVDLLWLDLQGSEPEVLMASKLLHRIKYLYTEVSLKESYEGSILYDELKQFMLIQGFEVYFEDNRWDDMGNVLFINKKI